MLFEQNQYNIILGFAFIRFYSARDLEKCSSTRRNLKVHGFQGLSTDIHGLVGLSRPNLNTRLSLQYVPFICIAMPKKNGSYKRGNSSKYAAKISRICGCQSREIISCDGISLVASRLLLGCVVHQKKRKSEMTRYSIPRQL